VRPLYSSIVGIALAALVSCTGAPPGTTRLVAVQSLPKPSLPPWILSVSPIGQAQALAQIRVIFAKPLVPVSALSEAGSRDTLAHFSISPDLGGRFVLLTPRMVGFVADRALPVGTRVRVTIGAGLRDLDGDSLPADVAWTFGTPALSLTDLPQLGADENGETPAPSGINPKLAITSNAALDEGSLSNNATLVGGGESVGVTAALEATPSPVPGSNAAELYDPSLNDWKYDLKPLRQLRQGTTYALRIAPGVTPQYGNVPSARNFDGQIRTFDALTIVPTPLPSPNSGSRFADGDPVIAFNNPLDADKTTNAVTISPAPTASVKALFSVPDQSNTIFIDPYALDPNRTYVATIDGSVGDVYGQTLGQPHKVTIHTSGFAPGAWAPTGASVIPAGAPVDLNFYATNLPDDSYQVAYAKVAPIAMLGYPDPNKLLGDSKSWPSATLRGARPDAQSVVKVPLRARIGADYGALAYGFRTALDAQGEAPSLTGVVQLTNLGVYSQWFPAHGIVMVQRLSDGAPVSNAAVTVYRIDNSSNNQPPQPCASGSTNGDGQLEFHGVDVERCSALASANNAPNLGVVVTQGADVATVTTLDYSGSSRFNVSAGWTSGAPLGRGTIFSDRQMYQPGERAQITGIAYYVKGSQVVPDANASYKVTLTDPSNATSSLGTRKTDSLGVFSFSLPFSQQQALGYYTLDAKGSNGNDVTGSLRVAEFKPPNFNLTLTLSGASATAGSSLHAGVAANYLFGAPLQGGTAHAYVTRDVASLQPKGWDDFSFGPQWFYPEETPSFTTDVVQRDLALDSKGTASLDVTVPRDLPFPMTYQVDMQTSDVSNLSVSDSKSFLALPADVTIGLASDTVGKEGSAMPIRAIVTDADGNAVSGRGVHLELQKMTYTSATQEEEGGQSAQQAIKYQTVDKADVTSGGGPVTANLTPPAVGPYRVMATLRGAPNAASSAASATQIQVFAFGPGEADWGLQDQNAVAIKLDKKQYAIGDTASAMVASPYDDADVYVAVVRNDVIERTTLHGVHGTVRVPFKVTPAMMPNAAVQALVVRRGGPLGRSPKQQTLSLTGLAAFSVDVASRYLKVGIAPRSATVQPGVTQSVDFNLTAKDGSPARGEIVAMVVNDAILQLSGYRLPDLVQTVFAQQPIATIFSDNRENVTLTTQTPTVEKGFGYGGGFLAGAASTRVRANFQPMPYYGVLKTDASGRAHATFTMPDDLTTWRVMAVALDDDASHFATSDKTFVSTQPLIANPLLPQFARPGDKFSLGVSIANQTGSTGALDLVLQLSGALAFAQGDPQKLQTTENAASGMQAYRFGVLAGTPAPSQIEAQSALGSQRDAFRVPFDTTDRAVTESVIESGVSAKQAAIPIDLRGGGSLQLTLANSVIPQLAVPSDNVLQSEAFPLSDDYASRLIVASALAKLRGPYRLQVRVDPVAAAASNLQNLLGYQHGDGGFAYFSGDTASDPFATSGAIAALTFARSQGVKVDSGAISRAAGFMSQALANPGRFRWCSDALCKAQVRFEALWSLAQAGQARSDFLSDVVARGDAFDSATRIRLARFLLRAPGRHAQGVALADQLTQQVYLTGRYATANLSAPWAWLGSQVDAQAQMLQMMLERRAPAEQIDGAVRALIAQQCRCGWPTTDDTAAAMTALAAYARTEQLRPATVTASVRGRVVARAQFGSTVSSQRFTIAAATLGSGALTIDGPAHYLVLYTYPVPPNSPGELAAFRVIRTLADPSVVGGAASAPLATIDLAPVSPVSVAAGRVFDVGVRAIVDHPVDRLVIEDALPAGFEAVDTSFRTSLQAIVSQSDSWQIDATQIYRDRVVAFAAHLEPGVYDVHYLVRSVTPGTFSWPGARVYLRDAPEQFGRSAAARLEITSQ
jgi:hypothetical protein